MATITIKNIPEDLYTKLKRHAEINRRSINSEVILCIERVIGSRNIQPQEYLAKACKLREKTKHHMITDEEFYDLKTVGRP